MKNKVLYILLSAAVLTLITGCTSGDKPSETKVVVGWLQKNQTNVFETYINKGDETIDRSGPVSPSGR